MKDIIKLCFNLVICCLTVLNISLWETSHLSIHLFICPCTKLPIHLSMYPFISPCIHLLTCPSFHPSSTHWSICPSSHSSILVPICPSIHLNRHSSLVLNLSKFLSSAEHKWYFKEGGKPHSFWSSVTCTVFFFFLSKSKWTSNCLVFHLLQNSLFCVQHKK